MTYRPLTVLSVLVTLVFSLCTQKNFTGNHYFIAGDYDKALEKYGEAIDEKPTSPEVKGNFGNALYKDAIGRIKEVKSQQDASLAQQQMASAQKEYDDAIAISNTRTILKSNLYYNLGNTHFMTGKLDESTQSIKNSLRIDSQDEDAKYNYYFIKMMELQKQSQEQQQQQQQQEQQQDQKDQKTNKDLQQQQEEEDKDKKNGDEEEKANPKKDLSEEEMDRYLDALREEELKRNQDEKNRADTVQDALNPEIDW